MLISTRGRYALRIMIDLAEHYTGNYIPMKDVAKRQNISLKYLERIMPILTKNNLVIGMHGKGGGYKLVREPHEYIVEEILSLTEGSLAPVSCLENKSNPCEHALECRTLPLWNKLNDAISDCLKSVTIADLMQNKIPSNYII